MSSFLIPIDNLPLRGAVSMCAPTRGVCHWGWANMETVSSFCQSGRWKWQACCFHVHASDCHPSSKISPIHFGHFYFFSWEPCLYIFLPVFSIFSLIFKSSFVLYWRHNPWTVLYWTVLYVGNGLSLFQAFCFCLWWL